MEQDGAKRSQMEHNGARRSKTEQDEARRRNTQPDGAKQSKTKGKRAEATQHEAKRRELRSFLKAQETNQVALNNLSVDSYTRSARRQSAALAPPQTLSNLFSEIRRRRRRRRRRARYGSGEQDPTQDFILFSLIIPSLKPFCKTAFSMSFSR